MAPVRPRPALRTVLAAAGAALAMIVWTGHAQPPPNHPAQPPTEYQVKAAFLYNFAKFTDWPAPAFDDASEALVIGVLGADPFGPALDAAVHGKVIHSRIVRVRRIERAGDAAGCHLLYIAPSAAVDLPVLLPALAGEHIMTVGESSDFTAQGGIVRLYMEDDRVRFEVNVGAAEQARLAISSKLLALARVVGAGDAGGGGR